MLEENSKATTVLPSKNRGKPRLTKRPDYNLYFFLIRPFAIVNSEYYFTRSPDEFVAGRIILPSILLVHQLHSLLHSAVDILWQSTKGMSLPNGSAIITCGFRAIRSPILNGLIIS